MNSKPDTSKCIHVQMLHIYHSKISEKMKDEEKAPESTEEKEKNVVATREKLE